MKNRLMSLVLSGVAIIGLNACGGGGDDGDTGSNLPIEITEVDILDLDEGYQINGVNDANEDVTLEYCANEYDYYRGDDEAFHGTFNIGDIGSDTDVRINMFDDDGGTYVIDTDNGHLHIDEIYDIDFVNDEIDVESIVEISC